MYLDVVKLSISFADLIYASVTLRSTYFRYLYILKRTFKYVDCINIYFCP